MNMTDELLIKKYEDRLSGYTKIPRVDFILLKQAQLKESEWYLYMLLKEVVADWDSRHTLYGCFSFNEDQIAYYTGWHKTKIKRIFKSICAKGLAPLRDKNSNLYTVLGLDGKQQFFKKKGEIHE